MSGNRKRGAGPEGKNYTHWLGCHACNKRAFATKKEAKKAARHAQTASGISIRNYYRCPEGMGWHLTSQSKEVSRWYEQNK